MQLKGKTSALILWLLMTLASVLISAWMHRLATHTPSNEQSLLVKRNFDVMMGQLQRSLRWLAQHPDSDVIQLPEGIDLRLVFDQQDVQTFQTTLADTEQQDSLLSNVIAFLKVPRQTNIGVTYWRDKVVLMAIEEQGETYSVTATFLGAWLLRLSDVLDYHLEMSAIGLDGDGDGVAVIRLDALVGKPVYVSVSPLNNTAAMPYRWWLAVLLSALVSAVMVWVLYYRPIWYRVRDILTQSHQIMKSGDFKQRIRYQGKDDIAELAVQVNAILSSLEYCYNLMAKTNLITTELLQKVDRQASVEVDTALTEEGELKSSLDVVSRLSMAFETDALEVFVQPVFSADRTQVTGYEALARWMDPELGLVAPTEFLSMCDKAGLLDMMTRLMIHHSLDALAALRQKHDPSLVVSLNLSASQFFSPALMVTLESLNDEQTALLSHLEFEVRETTITHDFERALVLMQQLKQKGVRLCIDDFGMSRYSLMYLQRLPVSSIKLAAAFTERLAWEQHESDFIDGIARFAEALGVRVIVKNIETDGQLETLGKGLPVEYQGVTLEAPAPLEAALKR